MESKELLKKRISRDREKLYKLEQKENDMKWKKNFPKFIGKCFVYRNNSFGSAYPGKWDMFRQILKVDDKTRSYWYEEFSVDVMGKFQFLVDKDIACGSDYNKNPFTLGWTEISLEEYRKEKTNWGKKLLKARHSLDKEGIK